MINGWGKSNLGHICQVISGSTPKTNIKEYWTNGEINWITPNDLSKLKNKYINNIERKITASGLKSCSTILINQESLIMSSRAPIGYLAISNNFCTNQGCKSFVFNDNNSISFFYYQLLSNVAKLKQIGEGTTFAEVSKKQLESFEILHPKDIKEQQKIAKILTSVDESIEATNKIIAKQKRVKTALMQDLLTHGIDEDGNIRGEETHEFKDSVLGRIPKEWDIKTLANICMVRDGTHQTPKYVNEGMPFYSVETITKNDFKNVKYVSLEEHLTLTKNFRIERNDVLMTRIGSIGDCKYINWDVNASFYVSLALLKFNNPTLAQYFTQYSNHQIFETEISLHSLPFAIPKKINLGNISDVRVIIPLDSSEQEKITKILSKQDEAIEQEEQKLHKLQRVKKALMQDLLTGKVRVNYE